MLSVKKYNTIKLSDVILSIIMLSDIMHCVTMPRGAILSVIMLSVIKPNAIMLSDDILSVIN
jgi:hypothetical protein